MTFAAGLALLLAAQEEQRISDVDYERSAARFVKAIQALEKGWKADPAAALPEAEAALKGLQDEFFPRFPRHVETTLVVIQTRGIDKGEVKERQPFYPYRLAGQIALAAGRPERAVELLEKSPSSRALLEQARAALAEKQKAAAAPPLQKPALTLAPFLDRADFAGAVEAIRRERERLGKDYDRLMEQVRAEAVRHQKARTAAVAAVLPRLSEPQFREEHIAPCLQACGRLPADFEIEELRWVRRLGEWSARRDPEELDRLALAAAKFDPDFYAVCEQVQRARVREIEKLVEALREAPRDARRPLLVRLDAAERAFREQRAAREYPELVEALDRAKARLPIDDQALEDARRGVGSVSDIRVMAGKLEALWKSDARGKLAAPDLRDLALYLAIYRSYALFLEGRTIDEVARDPRVEEAFRLAPDLPPDASPKLAEVRRRLGK
jgi:hypothetical protein